MMNQHTKRSFAHATLLTVTALLPLASLACTGGDSFRESEAALGTVGTGGTGGTPIGPINGGWAPLPVWLPTAFQVSAATTSSVTLTWNEHGGNGTTILYRQLYDLAGNLDGSPVVIHTFTSLPAGKTSFTDSNGLVRTMALAPGGVWGYSPIKPDHMIRYDIMEIASGYNDCEYFPGGPTCLSTSTNAYIPSAVAYGAGRLQVRAHVAQATSGASNLHVRAELSAWNTTWLDSTQSDFAVGSNITYDLATDAIDSRSDILFVDLWTPDPDGVCVDDLQLKVDNTTTFHKTFAPCQWVGNHGGEIFIPFTALRSSAEWQAYKPYAYQPGPPPVTFIGFNAEGLTSYLDALVGSQLRNPIPTPQSGNDAKLGAKTTLTRTDPTHLHVQQHLVNIHVVWDGIDFGTVSADPSYDLVIHHADSACTGWCVKVENAQGNSTYTGWTDYILDVLSLGVVAAIHAGVNDRLENALSKSTSSLPNPGSYGYCFQPSVIRSNDPVALASFWDDGTQTPFDGGSLTVCFYPGAN
jgi:hypothetical protein